MSVLYQSDPDDFNIDWENKEIDVYVTYDNLGSIYKILTFADIENLYREIQNASEGI